MRRFLSVILLASAAAAAEDGPVSAEAEYHFAQGLERMGFPFSAFAHYAAIIRHPCSPSPRCPRASTSDRKA